MEHTITKGYVRGIIADVTRLHAVYYYDNWGFDLYFEMLIAEGMVAFMRDYDDTRDGIWTVSVDGQIEACIVIDGKKADTDGARLRLFIIGDKLRGQGLGRKLMQTAIDFCDNNGYARVTLGTFAGLDVARHLYESFGFELKHEEENTTWGNPVREQHFERDTSK